VNPSDPQTSDLIICARWVVPMEPAGLLLEDYAVVVKGGRIQALLPASEVRRSRTAGQTINPRPRARDARICQAD
jgi:5-methylthioadenosine/S-adenosylhomocysteine deaminase